MIRRSLHYVSRGVWFLTLIVGRSSLETSYGELRLSSAVHRDLEAGVDVESSTGRRRLSGTPHVLKELGYLEKSIMGSRAESAAAAVYHKSNATAHHGTAATTAALELYGEFRAGASNSQAASFKSRPQLGSPNLTTFTRADNEGLYQLGCKLINDVPSEASIEQKKQSGSLKFALLYSGQVCHGRGADVLHHPAMMQDLWANHVANVHAPLAQWGRVDLFGLFEEMSADAMQALTHTSATQAQADGCNDFSAYANWTKLEFMPSEMHVHSKFMLGTGQAKTVRHGEERRMESLKRFVGLARWRNYDFFLQFRPDIKFRRPITEWGIDLRKINVPHWESNGMRECDASKLAKSAAQGLISFPAVGDAYFLYPQRWAPLVLTYGAVLLGRGGISWLRSHCSCAPDLATLMTRDLHVVETIACHNTRSCFYHPDYYLYGERLCDEPLRPGESPGEFCNRGRANHETGILSCAFTHARRWRATSLEGQQDEARWYGIHYLPFTSVELFPCMERSRTGWLCPGENGGACRKASCADVPEPAPSSSSSLPADVNTSAQAAVAAAKVSLLANATLDPLKSMSSRSETSVSRQNPSEPLSSRGPSERHSIHASAAAPPLSSPPDAELDRQNADAAFMAATTKAVAAAKVKAQEVAEASGLAAKAAAGDEAAAKRMKHDETALVNKAKADVGETSPTGVKGLSRQCNRITGKCFMVNSG